MSDPALPIRVAIIEDQREIREGLKTLVSGTPGHRVTGAWRSIEEALAEIARNVPDVALVDIGTGMHQHRRGDYRILYRLDLRLS
jgi:DNA-binding NarL/FixJ family response regulator